MPYIIPDKSGYATAATAGRSGTVIHVTTTADGTTPGTLRWALRQTGVRNIVFDTSGEFVFSSAVYLNSTMGNVHVWGQTAPGPVRIRGTIRINCNNVCIEHVDMYSPFEDTGQQMPIDINGNNSGAQNIVISQCTFIHGWRESFQIWTDSNQTYAMTLAGVENVDFLDCLFVENLLNPELDNNRGGIVQGNGMYVSIQRSLFSNNDVRNPTAHTGTETAFVNNFCWNPGNTAIHNLPDRTGVPCHINIVGCVIEEGDQTIDYGHRILLQGNGGGSTYYLNDNVSPLSTSIGSGWSGGASTVPAGITVLDSSAISAYILANAGARPWEPTDDTVRAKNWALVDKVSYRGDLLTDWPAMQTITPSISVFPTPANHTNIEASGYSTLEEFIRDNYEGAGAEIQPITLVTASVDPTVDAPSAVNIFNLDHETGDFSQYDATVTDGGDLTVSAGAALAGTGYGLSCLIDDTNNIYGTNDFAQFTTGGMRLRIYIDPNGLTMGSGDSLNFVHLQDVGTTRFILQLYYNGSNYQVRAQLQYDGGGWNSTSYYTITDAPHYVEVSVVRATSAVASDGTMALYIDGALQQTKTGIDLYDLGQVSRQRAGCLAISAGISGTLYLDEFVLRDDNTEIGALDLNTIVIPSQSSLVTGKVDPTIFLNSTSTTPDPSATITEAAMPATVYIPGAITREQTQQEPVVLSEQRTYNQGLNMQVYLYKPTIGSYVPNGTLVEENLGEILSSLSFDVQALGGMWKARFSINDRLSNLEDWIDRLGYHFEVYSPYMVKVWEGFINTITINAGSLSVVRGPLINTGNRVRTIYSSVDTSVSPPAVGTRETTTLSNDTNAQGKYGIIEKVVSVGGATADTAVQIRDTWIEENALPETSQSFNSMGNASPNVSVECLGYVHWLKLFTYNDTTTGTRELSEILRDIFNYEAASVNGMFSTDLSRIETPAAPTYTSRYTNDYDTAWNRIKYLVSQGDANDSRWLFGIYADRKPVYTAAPTSIEYQQRISENAQRVRTISGQEVKPWDMETGKWLEYTDFLVGKLTPETLRDDPRIEFVESFTYTMPYGLTHTGSKANTLSQKLAKLGLGGAG